MSIAIEVGELRIIHRIRPDNYKEVEGYTKVNKHKSNSIALYFAKTIKEVYFTLNDPNAKF